MEMEKITRIVGLIGITLALLWTIFPIYWLFITGIKTQTEVLTRPPILIPPDPDWHFYWDTISPFGRGVERGIDALKDSIIISTSTTVLSVLFGSMAAYVLSVFPKRVPTGGESMAFTILTFKMMPPIVVALPLFWLFYQMNLLDTHIALIISFTSFNLPFVIWLMKGFFDDIPKPILEAAFLDGYSPFQMFRKIALPLVGPGLMSVTALCFVFSWNEFLISLILTATSVRPFTVTLVTWMTAMEIAWAHRAALAMIGSVPPLIVIWLLRERLVRGLTLGAVKY